MVDKIPTQEQIREFWEWCGFCSNAMKLSEGGWNYPNGGWDIHLPPIDLNNLFKYAVPKLQRTHLIMLQSHTPKSPSMLKDNFRWDLLPEKEDGKYGASQNKDPALTLFWAIWEVIHGTRI